MAMRDAGLNKKLTFDKIALLEILRKNRDGHAKIVREAQEGWAAGAEKRIRAELDKVLSAKRPCHLSFSLAPPVDYTSVYDTFIMQLDMAKETELELDGDQFRKLVQDKWDWTSNFLASNAVYSGTAAMKLED